jgi:hypothetical protein
LSPKCIQKSTPLALSSSRPSVNENEIIIKANGSPLDMHALVYEIETRGNKSTVWGIIIAGNAKHGIEKVRKIEGKKTVLG